MENAIRFDDRITIGTVPILDDLIQLRDLHYRTLVDLRDQNERFGGRVKGKAASFGFEYVDIPVSRESIRIEDVKRFYEVVFQEGSAPLYVFSRFGKKPLAFLLIFEAVAKGEPVSRIFRRASRFGLDLNGDLCLQEFIVSLMNSHYIEELVESIRKLRPDLLNKWSGAKEPSGPEPDRIQRLLEKMSRDWASRQDPKALRVGVKDLLDTLGED